MPSARPRIHDQLRAPKAIMRSDQFTRAAIGPLKRIGLRDLDHSHSHEAGHEAGHGEARRIVILGFFRAASALTNGVTTGSSVRASSDF